MNEREARQHNMSSFSLLAKIDKGWRFVYRSKKAHYFENRQSLCNKHTISEYEEGGLLPFVNPSEYCKQCLVKRKEITP